MDARFRVVMLGRFEVRQGNRDVTRFRTQKTGALLACLARHRGRSHARDALIEQFWPDRDLTAARSNLSVALNALRRQLEPPGVPAGGVLVADRAQVRLNPAAFTTDVEEFEDALRTAASASAPDAWATAADLYGGDLLPGYYENWVLAERDRLRDAWVAALGRAARGFAALGERERAIRYARLLAQADPFEEESHLVLIRLLADAGRPQDALRQYREMERILDEDRQDTPSDAARALAARLGDVRPAAAASREPPPSPPPPPPTVAARAATPALPLQFTRFFGREGEMDRVAGLLDPDADDGGDPGRLVTLTGPGGTGKTRLSVEVAGRVSGAFPGGVWFVALEGLDDPLRLGEALRDAMGLPPRSDGTAALDQVVAHLDAAAARHHPALLVLDNFEQIAAGGAPVVRTLLGRVASLRCLVTSRRALSLPGEREVFVPPLPTPDANSGGDRRGATPESLAALADVPSVALFVDRAQAVRPDFQITARNAAEIAALCEELEGIPLALELAAARARLLTPAQMRERLAERFGLLAAAQRDRGERHRSLWAAMDWSYQLLSPDLRRAFARLSVFRGGWTLEAAGDVAGADADALALLRAHSLVHAAESSAAIRFGMLESLREFASEQLTPDERGDAARRHARYFREWADGARFTGGDRALWFGRFEEEFDNLRAVFARSLRPDAGGEVGEGLATAAALSSFWWLRGHLPEGRRWFARLLDAAGGEDAPATTPGLGRSLLVAGTLAFLQGDFDAARALLLRCLAAAAGATGEERLPGLAHEMLGSVAYRQGDYGQARSHYEQALARARALGHGENVASALGNLANVAQSSGDFNASRALNEECLAIWRAKGDRNGEARTLHNLANLAQSQGRLAEARGYYEQGLAIHRETADRYGMGSTLRGVAEVAIAQGEFATAAARARESLALARDLDARVSQMEILRVLTDLVRAVGEPEAAARAHGALEQIREAWNYPVPPVDREETDRAQASLRESLGPAAFDAEKAAGRALSLEQALGLLEDTLAARGL